MAKSEYVNRNEEFVAYYERKPLIFGGSNGVTGDSDLLLSPPRLNISDFYVASIAYSVAKNYIKANNSYAFSKWITNIT